MIPSVTIRHRTIITAIMLVFVMGWSAAYGEAPVPPPAPPERPGNPADWGKTKEPPIKKVGKNLYQIETIVVNAKDKTITLRGEVNMQDGLVELLACGLYGKRHESVLMIPVEPYHVQVALLLLGLHPGKNKLKYQGDPGEPQGDPIEIFVEWNQNGSTVKKRAEDLVFDKSTNHSMPHTQWVFTGSVLHDGNFMAQIEQSLVTTYHDPATIIDNPLSGGKDDTLYFANKEVIPPVGTPVKMIIKAVRK